MIDMLIEDDTKASEKEIRALRAHVSTDETRTSLCQLWTYADEGGRTYVASDSHTLCVRRSGKHRDLKLHEFKGRAHWAVDDSGADVSSVAAPPAWWLVLKPGALGELAEAYGMNPRYLARVADVERAAGQRDADDFRPNPGTGKAALAKLRSSIRDGRFATWVIPADALDVWYWKIDAISALWEGVIMPRRV